MTRVVLLLAAALWTLAWTLSCAREALRLYRLLYPNGIRLVIGRRTKEHADAR
jgi:hypothetical protein